MTSLVDRNIFKDSFGKTNNFTSFFATTVADLNLLNTGHQAITPSSTVRDLFINLDVQLPSITIANSLVGSPWYQTKVSAGALRSPKATLHAQNPWIEDARKIDWIVATAFLA